MALTLTEKILAEHGDGALPEPGKALNLRFDQTLCQDATGTMVMLTLEAMGLERVATDVSVQYVDHNLLQEDYKNPDDHLFLLSAARRFGAWYSRPGNGISHPLHMQHFGVPGKTLIGSDSHTCAAGCLGMFAMGAGGTDVALAMAGERVQIPMPEVWGIYLYGELKPWVSAKDVILTLLRDYGVEGGLGRVMEYHGPGLASLSAMDRHVIANMGAELGATASLFPSDDETRRYLQSENRGTDWRPLSADEGCEYHHVTRIDLGEIEPMIAKPSSPGNVVAVCEVEGEPIYQAYIGSSANPGYRDFAIAATIVRGETLPEHVSLDINPSSRQTLRRLMKDGYIDALIDAGARLHQAGCNGCIGMGQAPATEKNSLRTTPRNFPGRSGTPEDRVWLCSPETAAASALFGYIMDPRKCGKVHPGRLAHEPDSPDRRLLVAPRERDTIASSIELEKGPNIASLPQFSEMEEQLDVLTIARFEDDVSTDDIMPAGAEVLPFRSNIPAISQFCFKALAPDYVSAARAQREAGGHAIVAGKNYGQGSSREHAAIAPRYLGLRVVLAKSFARIHRQNLINFGVIPLYLDELEIPTVGSRIRVANLRSQLMTDAETLELTVEGRAVHLRHALSVSQKQILLEGGLISWLKRRGGEK